jgi:large subunit ribosomal protein L5
MAESNGAGKPRLQAFYEASVRGKLQQDFGFSSPMQIPRLEKVVINVGLGEASKNPKLLDGVVSELGQITGQKAVVTRAKKAISNFGLRENQPVGASVTLRRDRMWEFLDRLISIALPRVRDFRGVPSKSFDGRGNYTLGIRDHLIFPEVDYNKVERPKGMNITIVTTAGNDERALYMLRELGMPFTR